MYHFIVNLRSRAGLAKKTWKTIQDILDERGTDYKVYVSKYHGHATKIADMICNEYDGIKKIVVVGGDGTFNEVINGIHPYSDILMGYIPVGTGNDLAKGLGISKDPAEALESIINPHRYRYVDNGILNYYDGTAPRRFAVSAGLGFDAAICEKVSGSTLKPLLNKIGLGRFVYFLTGVKQIFENEPVNVEVLIDGTRRKRVNGVVFAAAMIQKTEGAGIKMAPSADNSDGQLTICMVHGFSKAGLLLLVPFLLMGRHMKFKGVDIFNCTSLEVTAKRAVSLHTDGEVPGAYDHIRFACLPEQIRMYA